MSYRIPYAGPVWGEREVQAVLEVLRHPSRQLAAGPKVAEFERRIAALFGQQHGVMVNSGSSANLLALSALRLPRGSRVVTPALTFSTSVAPILQLGLKPVFVDVEPDTYVANMEQVGFTAGEALLIPLLLGNIPDFTSVRHRCLVVDSCDTLGVEFPDAELVTTSFYASHVITAMGGGGMVCCGPEHVDRLRLLANWGRQSTLMQSDAPDDRYTVELAGALYDCKFLFPEVGYNMQATEPAAAFGLVQLDRLQEFLDARRRHFTMLSLFFGLHEEFFVVLHTIPYANWLAFPLVVRGSAPFSRLDFVRHLEHNGIQTRPIMAGNILRQPGFQHLGDPGRFPVADSVMRGGLLLGLHQGLTDSDISYITEVAATFLGGR